ncbi:MAG: type I DNA topoisomerase [Candidatus Phytoplasma pruni]
MKTQVIIVESPSKAKTLNSYFDNKILILSSKGHIRDLSLKGKNRLGIHIEKDFLPDYKIIPTQEKLVKDLIRLTKGKKVLLATDPDREGEAIAWHLAQVLNLKMTDKNRIFFTEITKDVVLEAFNKPSAINQSLVDSQETRRMLDRIMGFKLSRLVKRIKSQSAGRVQSVALKLIAELEQEREKFIPEEYNLIKALFENFEASLVVKPKDKKIKSEEAAQIVEQIKDQYFLLKEIVEKKVVNKSPKPFITASLQQEAFRHLSMNAKQTMINTQKLYEGIEIEGKPVGLITYMRTDSYRLSMSFMKEVKIFIKEKYGPEYLGTYQQLSQDNIQEAHEAIRITDIKKTPESLTQYLNKYQLSLYKMIYERTLTSLMANAVFNKTQLLFHVKDYVFKTEGLTVLFAGFYQGLDTNTFKNDFLPDLEVNKTYLPQEITTLQKFTTPPARFNEASLIKTLEQLKIGRPSTYSTIIETLKKRFYVTVEEKRFFCTEQGFLTKNLLDQYFNFLINIDYTAQMEENLDKIASGQLDKIAFLKNFYHLFQELYSIADQKIVASKPVFTEEKCSVCGELLFKRRGQYGEFLGCSAFPKCKNIIPSKEKTPSSPPVLTKHKCDSCGAFLAKRKGRYGEFLGCSNFPKCKKNVSLKDIEARQIEKE